MRFVEVLGDMELLNKYSTIRIEMFDRETKIIKQRYDIKEREFDSRKLPEDIWDKEICLVSNPNSDLIIFGLYD